MRRRGSGHLVALPGGKASGQETGVLQQVRDYVGSIVRVGGFRYPEGVLGQDYESLASEATRNQLLFSCLVAPEELRGACLSRGGKDELLQLLIALAGDPGLDLYATAVDPLDEVSKVLESEPLRFKAPPGPWKFILRSTALLPQTYAPQFVDDVPLFSPQAGKLRLVPMIHHSKASHQEFLRLDTFVHEALHVLQRVYRTTPQGEPGSMASLQNGLEDELEVQRILTLAGREFRLNPILYHRKTIRIFLGHLAHDAYAECINAILTGIDFSKYELLEGVSVEGIVREHLLEVDN